MMLSNDELRAAAVRFYEDFQAALAVRDNQLPPRPPQPPPPHLHLHTDGTVSVTGRMTHFDVDMVHWVAYRWFSFVRANTAQEA
jgi:hypothetical protein